MASQNRRSSFSASTMSSLAKRQADNGGKSHPSQPQPHLAKKRAPLSNITNNKGVVDTNSKAASTAKVAKTKKGTSNSSSNIALSANVLPGSSNIKPSTLLQSHKISVPKVQDSVSSFITTVSTQCGSIVVSPSKSDGLSVSMDETMSTCESFKSPEVEYMDNDEVPPMDSIDRKTFSNLYISEDAEKNASICNRDMVVDMETDEKIVDVDGDLMDPQMCATIACDIYKHLRASEVKKRPSTDFMERIQKDINASMRAILIDWLVEVAEEYRLVPDTLYLTVNYIDRYLSGNVMNRQRLQLLGVASMMIAAKYEEICAPQVEEFCYITDNTYFKEEVLQMESDVLNYLKFELTAPTIKCFLRRFVRAAQGAAELSSLQLECMANYLAELSLLEYSMLAYAPSLIAASAIFLAKYILLPSRKPWDPTLLHYTHYRPSDLCNCVKDLHHLCCDSHNSTLPAIREKYSQHKYKYVAKKHCPPSIPPEFFLNQGL